MLTGPSFDLGYVRYLLITGAVLNTVGMMATSVSHSYVAIL